MENVADIYPLSPSQEGMLFHTLAEPGSGVYVEQYACTFRGPLQPDVLRLSWERTVERHAALRTAFLWDGLDEPLQVVRREVEVPWTVLDWRDLTEALQRQRLDAFLREDRTRGFDAAKAPLLRMTVVRTGDASYRFLWSFHHLLLDGWSTAHVLNDVLTDYAARCQGHTASFSEPRPFRDYIAWLQGRDAASAEAFWTDLLRGFDTPTPLAVDRPAVRGTSGPYDQQERTLSEEVTTRLTQFARTHRLTLNTVVQGAWALLLNRYSGERDIVYGTTVSGRPAALQGVETMVGAFINTLPVRVATEPDNALLPWLRKLQERLLAARTHEHTPLAQIQRWSEVRGGRALFESLVVFENYPLDAATPAADVGVHVQDVLYREQSNFPLALLVVPGPALRLIAVYDTARLDGDAVSRMLGHVGRLLEAMAATPDATLGSLSLVSEAERAEILTLAAGPERTALPDGGVLSLIERHVQQSPVTVAVTFGEKQLTYAQLWNEASRLAAHLCAEGVGPSVPVGVCFSRSADLVVAILGILRAGGAYVPLDPGYPAERLRFMLEDAAAPVLIAQAEHREAFAGTAAQIVGLDDIRGDAEPPGAPGLNDLAYLIYTSGSTGRPKGVRVTHRNLVHSTQARLDFYDAPVGSYLLLSSVAFDSSVAGLFWTLASGGTLVLPPERLEQDVQALAALIERHGITHTLCLPSLWRVIVDLAEPAHLASLRCVIAAGEALPPDLVRAHYGRLPKAGLYNEYGPTEATVWATVHPVSTESTGSRIPIGRPIPGARAYVLDARGELAPIGVPGELVLGGDGVTAGYHDRPDRTAQAFIPDPFTQDSGARLYRTGDRARWLADGTLDFMGRIDEQVKVRGYRIELGEVEAALHQHPDLRDAVAVVHTPGRAQRREESDPSDVGTLAARLADLDPDHVDRLLTEVSDRNASSAEHATLLASLRDPS